MESPSDRTAAPALPDPGTLLGSRPLPAEFWPADASDASTVVYRST